jgi:DNA repair exonuclease SbcCD ATPase subunit
VEIQRLKEELQRKGTDTKPAKNDLRKETQEDKRKSVLRQRHDSIEREESLSTALVEIDKLKKKQKQLAEDRETALLEKARAEKELATTVTALSALRREIASQRDADSRETARLKDELAFLQDRTHTRLTCLERRSQDWENGMDVPIEETAGKIASHTDKGCEAFSVRLEAIETSFIYQVRMLCDSPTAVAPVIELKAEMKRVSRLRIWRDWLPVRQWS